MDVAARILDDHERQRRMYAALDEVARNDTESLRALWDRLRTFLEVHAEAEEELFRPRLLEVGAGSTDAGSSDEETADAISDHNETRDAIAQSKDREVEAEDHEPQRNIAEHS